MKADVKDASPRLSYMYVCVCLNICITCKRGSVGQSKGLLIPRSSVRFRLILANSNPHGFELHGPPIKGNKLLLKAIKAIIIIIYIVYMYAYIHTYSIYVCIHTYIYV